jgi:hypothetical protein
MSDATNFAFGKLVPGFDFLQGLATSAVKGASQAMPQLPNLGNWVAPTLNVEELEKRITELKAVQFWLDQNATALKATIQALEVQKMTLATLKGMNFNMSDVANAFKLKAADVVTGAARGSGADKAAEQATPAARVRKPAARKPAAKADAAPPAGVVDPMQWWGALTQQFQGIAAAAMKEAAQKTAIDATRNMATGIAKGALKTAGGLASAARDSAVKRVAGGAGKPASRASRAAG